MKRRRSMAALVAVALVVAACSDDDDGGAASTESASEQDPIAAAEERVAAAEADVAESQAALEAAHGQFCVDAESYLDAVDRYGKLFTDDAATVGDVQTLGADLAEPRDTVAASVNEVEDAKSAVAAAGQELLDAEAALAEAIATASSVPISSTPPETTTTTTLVPPATVDRVQQAEDDLADVSEGITASTPLSEATAEFNSAAFALQVAWLRLFADAGCFDDERQAEAVAHVAAYTTNLQTELQLVGYYDGEIDGIYGPATVEGVKRLQADSGLRETGFVDQATAAALDALLADLDLQQAAADLTHTASVQTVLAVTGYWGGPIDGVWTDELTAALQAFQTALGVEPTGVVDAATMAAFQQALAARGTAPPTTVPVDEVDDDPTVAVGDSALGQILTDAEGMTLYLFTPDAQGAPTCVDACAGTWPPLLVDDPKQIVAGDGVDVSLLATVDHPDGIQVTYGGWPLYLFSGDTVSGETNGQAAEGVWFVLDPTGTAVER